MSDNYVLVWYTGPQATRPHFANTDDGRVTWTKHRSHPPSKKGRPPVYHDRVATEFTFKETYLIKKSMCNPSLVCIQAA